MIELIKKVINKIRGGKKMRAIKADDILGGVTIHIKQDLTFQQLKSLLGNNGYYEANDGKNHSIISLHAVYDDYYSIINYDFHIGSKSDTFYSTATLFNNSGKLNFSEIEVFIAFL